MDGADGISLDLVAKAFSDSRLHLIVLPTEKCNFRCSYCYEDFRLGNMHPSVHKGLLNLINRRLEDLTELEIGWFGGEPLLNIPLIRSTTKAITKHKRVISGDCRFKSSMSTNAYFLNNEISSELVSLGVTSFQITLDGYRAHDETRKSVSGKKTFSVIWKNLMSMRQINDNFTVRIRIHVHKTNIPDVQNLLDMIVDNFNGDHRFHVFVKPVERLSGSTMPETMLSGSEKNEVVAMLKEKIKGTTLATPVRQYSAPCYASHANSFVIRSNGQIAKCTVDFNNPANDLGVLTEDGKMKLKNGLISPWIKGILEGDVSASLCPLVSMNKQETRKRIEIASM